MKAKTRSTVLDARVILLGFFLNVLVFPLYNHTRELIFLVGLSAFFLLAEGYIRRAVGLCVQFALFYLLAFAGARLVMDDPYSMWGMEFSIIGTMLQRIIPLLGYLYVLTRLSSGEFASVLMRTKMPKSVAIGIASLFRFIPALRQTFAAMRRASLFRGDGFRWKSILRHPARSFSYYLLPFLSRLSRVSDDLAASLSTKGVGMSGAASCARDLRCRPRDYVVLIALVCVHAGLLGRYL